MLNFKRAAGLLLILGIVACAGSPAFGAAATVKADVKALDQGTYLIKFNVTATGPGVYAIQVKDPNASVLDVYAPKGWCILTDGEACYASTLADPITAEKGTEFLIHSSAKDAEFIWTFFGEMEQIGKPQVL